MTNSQYGSIIKHTLENKTPDEMNNAALAIKEIFDNCGVAFPSGDNREILSILKTNDYMGWRACTFSDAQRYANEGVAAIGINSDRMVVIVPTDGEEAAVTDSLAQPVSGIPLADRLDMQFFAYRAATTTSMPGLSELAKAIVWIYDQADKPAKDTIKGNEGTQCVDLAAAYVVEHFNLPLRSMGNGKDVYKVVSTTYPDTFSKYEGTSTVTPRAGDIISLRGNDTRYGHVALVKYVSKDGKTIDIIEQWENSGTIRRAQFTRTKDTNNKRYIIGGARPKIM